MKFKLVKFIPKKNQVKGLECLNCGQPFRGDENFCSYCGQKNTVKKLSFGTFVTNMFSGFFSYDSRFWTTIIPLLTRPGKVSKDFISGKRARFVNPFQMYLNVSIIFFIILGISNRTDAIKLPIDNTVNIPNSIDSLKKEDKEQLDSILKSVKEEIDKTSPNDSTSAEVIANLGNVFKLTETENMEDLQNTEPYQYHIKKDTSGSIRFWDKIQDFQKYYSEHPEYSYNQALDSLGYEKTFWNTFHYEQIITTNGNWEQMKKDSGKSYIKKLTSSISISLFVFLPIFTLFLNLLYIRRKFTYMEHLVFVFHTQTVFFLLFILFYLVDFVVSLDNVAWVLVLLFLFYLYKSLRNFYEQGRFKTITKFIILNSFYMFLALVGLTIVAAISFLTN